MLFSNLPDPQTQRTCNSKETEIKGFNFDTEAGHLLFLEIISACEFLLL